MKREIEQRLYRTPKGSMLIFPLEKEDFDKIRKEGTTNKVFYVEKLLGDCPHGSEVEFTEAGYKGVQCGKCYRILRTYNNQLHDWVNLPEDDPLFIMVGFKQALEELKDSEGIKAGIKARWSFAPIDVDEGMLKRLENQKKGDDVAMWNFPDFKVAVIKKELLPEKRARN